MRKPQRHFADPAKCCRQYARENKKEEEALCPMRKAATMDKNPDAEPTRVVRLTDPNCSSVFSAVGSCFSGMPFWYPALSGWQPCADPGHPCKCQPTSYAFWVVHEFAHNLFSGIGRLGEYVGCFDRADRCSLNPQGSFPDSFLHDKAAAVRGAQKRRPQKGSV